MCNHKGGDKQEECFVNAPHIKFKKCKKCGEEEYPFKTYAILNGKDTTLLWPL